MGRFSQQSLSQPDPWAGQDDDPYEYRYGEPFLRGRQHARIKWFCEHAARNGNLSYKVTWGLAPAPGEQYGCKVDQYLPRVGPRVLEWLKAVAPEVITNDMDPPDQYFSGKVATLEVAEENDEYMGETRTRPKIDKVLPFNAYVPPLEAFEL